MSAIKITGYVSGCAIAILLAVILLVIAVPLFVVGYWKQTDIVLDGPLEMRRHVEGRGNITMTIDADIQDEVSDWLSNTRRLWWIDFNSYAPYNHFGTDNFSIRTTGCSTLVVLNFKKKSNGDLALQRVAFNDKRMRNILTTMQSRYLEYLEFLEDSENENDAQLEKIEETD